MLALIDGRSVYTPLFSGVFWDVQDVMLEDVERIEVIRGRGPTWSTEWSTITKRAEDTQGGLVAGGFGNEEQGFGGVRYGGKIGANAHYRVYEKHFSRSESVDSMGNPGILGYQPRRYPSRLEPVASGFSHCPARHLRGRMNQTTQPHVFFPPYTQEVTSQTPVSSGNVLSRWNHFMST
jgi:iron complex outermembrane receptor protein